MKKYLKLLLLTLVISLFSVSVHAGTNPPDPPGHGETGDQQAGGGAPIGGGLFILLGLGAAYGGRKLYQMKTEKLEEEE